MVDTAQPPTGRVVTAEGEPPRVFSGWLDLLGILARAISAGGVGGRPGKRRQA